jgi:chromosome segregation ATPase
MNEDGRKHIERMETQMAFIVEQQAKYEVRSAKADERWAEADKRWAKADERWASTEQSIRALLAVAEIHEREFEALREAGKELREAGKATDERLSVLINIVERHINDGHNHKHLQE